MAKYIFAILKFVFNGEKIFLFMHLLYYAVEVFGIFFTSTSDIFTALTSSIIVAEVI